jgi:hypothetical protein
MGSKTGSGAYRDYELIQGKRVTEVSKLAVVLEVLGVDSPRAKMVSQEQQGKEKRAGRGHCGRAMTTRSRMIFLAIHKSMKKQQKCRELVHIYVCFLEASGPFLVPLTHSCLRGAAYTS